MYLCNKECTHCHIRAGPDRTEVMNWETMKAIISHANLVKPKLVDITGGAPEINPHLTRLVAELTKADTDHFSVWTVTEVQEVIVPEVTADEPEDTGSNMIPIPTVSIAIGITAIVFIMMRKNQ